jgi:hypothetical protein
MQPSVCGLFEPFDSRVLRPEPFIGFLDVFLEVVGTDEWSIQYSWCLTLSVALEELDANLRPAEMLSSYILDSGGLVPLGGFGFDELRSKSWTECVRGFSKLRSDKEAGISNVQDSEFFGTAGSDLGPIRQPIGFRNF